MPDANPQSAEPSPQSQTPPVRRAADPCTVVIFGAYGDLTKRLVVPALYNLARTKALPENVAVIGVDMAAGTAEDWRARLHDMLQSFVGNTHVDFDIDHIDTDVWASFAAKMSYLQGDITKPEIYQSLTAALADVEKTHGTGGNVIFYLAVADRFFATVVDQLGIAKLTEQPAPEGDTQTHWRRVVIEKPFGRSLETARGLNARLRRTLDETQIFRIDHFLGKDTVQSIMAFRFANGLFEPAWNRDRIDHVQITIAETIGVERRGKFYEETGALRDMVPNHALTLVSMVAMEPPPGFDAGAVRSARADVFTAMPVVPPARAVRGQYSSGRVLGEEVKAYREEPDVGANSNIETFAAIEFEINNPRWAGVPFFVRTGKHMSQRMTEIAIRFKQAPFTAFQGTPVAALRPNWLVLRITPDKGISMQFDVKRPGPEVELATVKMDFRYNDWFADEPNVGYETLLHDVMVGDQTLFMRADMVENAWRIVQPVLDSWAAEKSEVPLYPSGTDGPPAADALLADTGDRAWRCIGGAGDEKS
jgi:glucose-6-phosphate 1-dehydrogenase